MKFNIIHRQISFCFPSISERKLQLVGVNTLQWFKGCVPFPASAVMWGGFCTCMLDSAPGPNTRGKSLSKQHAFLSMDMSKYSRLSIKFQVVSVCEGIYLL